MIPVIRPLLGAEEASAAAKAIESGWIAQGPRVAEFEAAFAGATGTGHAVAVSSCTAALHLAMIVAGVSAGDEVVVPSMSFIATANAARYVGAEAVFADVDPATLNLTPATVEPLLTDRTRAVILVDQAGVRLISTRCGRCAIRAASPWWRTRRARRGPPTVAGRRGSQPGDVLVPSPQAAHHR